jgi:hypothetical protein
MTDSDFCTSHFTRFYLMSMMMMICAYYAFMHTHDDNDDDVTYFGGHNATSIDGLRPTLEAPSTSWSEWIPTGVHSSDTGIRDEMR